MKKQIALYVRVSTDAQAEEGYSVGAQSERLTAYCKVKDWETYELYVDGGYTGSNLSRPAITKLIQDAQAGALSAVVVYKLDRLSRSQKDTLYLIEDVFLPNHVDFISLNENIDTSTPYGRAMIGILSAFAQLERENIFMRTRMGMLERVRKGLWPGGGIIPFGYSYDKEKGILIPNADAETVRKIYALYIGGESAQKIADMLGLRYERLVTQILTRRSNLGLIPYGGKEYPGLHEPLVSKETFLLAQKKMEERATLARVTDKGLHLLSGLLRCGYCGARLRYIQWGKSGYRLMCYSHDTSKPYMVKNPDCPMKPISAEEIEKIVLDDLFRISADLGEDSDTVPFLSQTEALRKREAQLYVKLKRLYGLFAEAEDDTLLTVIGETRQQLEAVRKSLSDASGQSTETEIQSALRGRIARISETWGYLSPKEKQTLLRDCVEKIILKNDSAEIRYTFLSSGNDSG